MEKTLSASSSSQDTRARADEIADSDMNNDNNDKDDNKTIVDEEEGDVEDEEDPIGQLHSEKRVSVMFILVVMLGR